MMLGLKGQHTQDRAIYTEGNFNGVPQHFVELAPSLRLYDARCPVKIGSELAPNRKQEVQPILSSMVNVILISWVSRVVGVEVTLFLLWTQISLIDFYF